MRTNIDIDDKLMADTMKAMGETTKKGAVEAAMRQAVRHQELKEALESLQGWDPLESTCRHASLSIL